MVAPESARRLLASLQDNLADLRRYRSEITHERLLADRDAQHMVLHAMYVAVQSATDLALHWGASEDLPGAATYADAFRRLAGTGGIDPALAERLAAWAGFRNVLAHFYAVVDFDRVFDALQDTGDLEQFARAAAAALS